MGLLVLVVVGMTIARCMLSDPSAPPHTVSTRTSLTWPLRRRRGFRGLELAGVPDVALVGGRGGRHVGSTVQRSVDPESRTGNVTVCPGPRG